MRWEGVDEVADDGFGDAFEPGGLQGTRSGAGRELGEGGVIDDDLPGGGEAAEAGGEIDAMTEDGVVQPPITAHAASDDASRGDADTDG